MWESLRELIPLTEKQMIAVAFILAAAIIATPFLEARYKEWRKKR